MADDLDERWGENVPLPTWCGQDKDLSDDEKNLETAEDIKSDKKKKEKTKKKKDNINSKKSNKIKNKSTTEENSVCSTKPKLKRKSEVIDSEDGQNKSEGKPVNKKKKRKKISDELLANKPTPGTAKDFLDLIKETYEGKLSTVEWDQLQIDEDDFLECNDVIDGCPGLYFKKLFPTWRKLLKASHLDPGSPLVLVITNSGARAVELNREIKEFKGEKCQCAKLFAKHFKIQDQQKFLTTKTCHIGVGTPQRIHKLIKLGCLKLHSLVAIVIDWNWRDIKFKRIVDIPEIKKDLLELFKDTLATHVQSSACSIGLL